MKINFLIPAFLFVLFTVVSCNKENEEPELETSYTKSIERISSNDFEKNLIEIAENTYPPKMDVMAAAIFSNIEIPDSAYWYYNSFDGVLIPYAITIDAINYYSELIEAMNAGEVNTIFITASFDYKSEVKYKEKFSIAITEQVDPENYENVFIVEMDLKWQNYCGSLCALWISKKRTVVFNKEGELIKIYFDGAESVAVS